ncbi:BadM/Rrf2 family transcriptional regulator [Tamaricihabitans halophyticus]|uniref:BadM/Rrf2 family transcriptional regulator n=1 Tax=Tamaricihabitans halophyticus TaxID=1262583 RepID=A0A4R2QEW1_9PSEU|nr:Rrf2 family transcriptional regulator [Tamaricihabitans halophyticus]TCP46828.1 BadM/Rrf2 family transcriptional regulator [Tamaricihabitans halophyticus]
MAEWIPERSPRGTVVLLPGRGEHPGVYARFGRRIALDGYRVLVPDPGEWDPAAWYGGEHRGARILIGADTGALAAWSVALTVELDGLVLAGTPLSAPVVPVDQVDELAARTSCPVHRELLSADAEFRWGALAEDAGAAPERLPSVPTLLLHGELDQITPSDPVRKLAARLPQASLALVKGGVHDILNDQFHRSVAARIVLFCEEIGQGAMIMPLPDVDRGGRTRRAALVQVSTKVDYAVRALIALARTEDEQLTCEQIARRTSIPLNSLVNLMVELRRAGVVASQRGCEGGYWLAREPATVSVAELVRVVHGSLISGPAGGVGSGLWRRLEMTIGELLDNTTIATIAADDAAPNGVSTSTRVGVTQR